MASGPQWRAKPCHGQAAESIEEQGAQHQHGAQQEGACGMCVEDEDGGHAGEDDGHSLEILSEIV